MPLANYPSRQSLALKAARKFLSEMPWKDNDTPDIDWSFLVDQFKAAADIAVHYDHVLRETGDAPACMVCGGQTLSGYKLPRWKTELVSDQDTGKVSVLVDDVEVARLVPMKSEA